MSKVEKPFVLIVDDNEATLTLLTALLQREFAVDLARDGQEAIDKLRTKNYGAALLDLRMPVIDGFAVLDFLKEERAEMIRRVIVVTAALTKSELSRVNQYEICGVIPKPFEVETLLAAVKECVGPDNANAIGRFFSSSVILLLADLLRQRLL
jgi:DNA-binding response OmpR family regulator